MVRSVRQKILSRILGVAMGITLNFHGSFAGAESVLKPSHGIAMYGSPHLPSDFTSLPYVNPNAPKGGSVVLGNSGRFNALNPFVQKGTTPWQMRFWGYESLMGRSQDEPFTLYGLLAESILTPPDRTWVEFTLRPQAQFWDGSPVTVEDVIWSYETLGTEGNLRYRSFWSAVDTIEQTGPRSVRLSFNTNNRELALIAGMRPILKKSQWEGRNFADAPSNEVVIGSGPYMVSNFEMGRQVTFQRNEAYWGKDLPLRRGTNNLDTIKLDFFGDQTVLFEAFKAGDLSAIREFNASKWDRDYDFNRVQTGAVIKTNIANKIPSGMTGLAFNTRRDVLQDWRVRDALITAFNFEFINDALTGGRVSRISSYFSNSYLSMSHDPAEGGVAQLLSPFADDLPPGALEGYTLPISDGSARNRKNLRIARKQLEDAGWSVVDGLLRNASGHPFTLNVLLKNGNLGEEEMQKAVDLYRPALERLGITVNIDVVDSAQYVERQAAFDYDMIFIRRALSLSPGNEQRLYWGSETANQPSSRNLSGIHVPAIDAMITTMLSTDDQSEFTSAVRALDRLLMAGRYVIPIWHYANSRIAHDQTLHAPSNPPIYGDGIYYFPEIWWSEASTSP